MIIISHEIAGARGDGIFINASEWCSIYRVIWCIENIVKPIFRPRLFRYIWFTCIFDILNATILGIGIQYFQSVCSIYFNTVGISGNLGIFDKYCLKKNDGLPVRLGVLIRNRYTGITVDHNRSCTNTVRYMHTRAYNVMVMFSVPIVYSSQLTDRIVSESGPPERLKNYTVFPKVWYYCAPVLQYGVDIEFKILPRNDVSEGIFRQTDPRLVSPWKDYIFLQVRFKYFVFAMFMISLYTCRAGCRFHLSQAWFRQIK